MITELELLNNSVFSKLNVIISHLLPDLECDEYLGHNFQLDQFSIKFRKAKITPKKIGQFVTLWKRNPVNKQTEPFTYQDPFDFYIIFCKNDDRTGFFFFSKQILIQQNILTTHSKDGKRGFRVYPTWDSPPNRQALKTQAWQQDFFIDFSDNNFLEKLRQLDCFAL